MSAETGTSAKIDFELSGLRFGGCNETVDVRAKQRSESAWRFCYARRKQVHSQNSNPHISCSSEANGMVSEGSVYQHPIRSYQVVGNIKKDIQHHRRENSDPAEASPIETEFELFGVTSGGCKGNTDIRAKRKSQNACRFHYVRSKRMHSQNNAPHFTYFLKDKSHMGSKDFGFDHLIRSHNLVQDTKMGIQHHRNGPYPDINHITEASEQNDSIKKDYYVSHPGEFPLISVKQSGKSNGDHAFEQDNSHDHSTVCENCADFRNCFIPGISGAPTARPESNSSHDLSRKAEEILAQELLSASPGDKRNALDNKLDSLNISSSNHDKIAILGRQLPDKLAHGQVHASVATSANDHIDLSNCVLNMAGDMDSDEGEGYCNGLYRHEMYHHDNEHKVDVFLLAQDPKLNREMCLGSQDFISVTAVVSDISEPAQCIDYSFDSLGVHESSIHVLGEITDEIAVCLLNREDPHIPWHDDLASCTGPFSSVTCQSHIDSKSDASSPDMQEISLLKTEENPPNTSINYQSVDQHKLPDEGPNKLTASCGVQTVFPNLESAIVVSREEIDAPAETGPLHKEPEDQNFTERLLMAESVEECNPMDDLLDGECSSLSVFHELDSSLSRLDDEDCESDYDDSKLTEIWEMIHSMDLYPGDQDSYVNGEGNTAGFGYRHDNKRGSSIRLERCAQSSIQKAIASGGPFAILYGQNSKHYIRKDEVLLGRETEDFQVDIDMGREGGTKKISRQQALIKLERDGTFFLKNLGRSSVFVNGTAVSGGNVVQLTTNCLIEVKGIKLTFGINEKSVRHHLLKLAKESGGANRNFEWSPEGSPSNIFL